MLGSEVVDLARFKARILSNHRKLGHINNLTVTVKYLFYKVFIKDWLEDSRNFNGLNQFFLDLQ